MNDGGKSPLTGRSVPRVQWGNLGGRPGRKKQNGKKGGRTAGRCGYNAEVGRACARPEDDRTRLPLCVAFLLALGFL